MLFVRVITTYTQQSYFRLDKFLPYFNLVGDFGYVQAHSEELLRRTGLWDQYGASGWGLHGEAAFFQRWVVNRTLRGVQRPDGDLAQLKPIVPASSSACQVKNEQTGVRPKPGTSCNDLSYSMPMYLTLALLECSLHCCCCCCCCIPAEEVVTFPGCSILSAVHACPLQELPGLCAMRFSSFLPVQGYC